MPSTLRGSKSESEAGDGVAKAVLGTDLLPSSNRIPLTLLPSGFKRDHVKKSLERVMLFISKKPPPPSHPVSPPPSKYLVRPQVCGIAV